MKNLLYISALLFSVTSFACNSLIDEKLRILDSTEFESLCKESVLILGGTSVHDYFLYADLIDEIFITIEPLKFGKGLPAFSYINFRDLVPYLNERGYRHSEKKIN